MGLMINDVDLKTTYKFVTTDVNGRGAPPIERSTLEDLSFDGAIELGTKLAKRDISITGYVYGTSPSDARTNKDNLISFISQGYSRELKLTFPDTSRSIYVKLSGTPVAWQAQGPTLNAVAYQITMNFVALDPFFYGAAYTAAGPNLVKIGTEAPLYLVNPRNAWLPRTPKLEIYPVTVVNLLGKYGDFETDSNSDGLADGWDKIDWGGVTTTPSLTTDRIFGSKAQKLNCSTTTGIDGGIFCIPMLYANNKYYFSTYLKIAVLPTGYFRLGLDDFLVMDTQVGEWHRLSVIMSPTSDRTSNLYCILHFTSSDGNPVVAEAIVDGTMLVNLTEMGQLPPPLKTYLGVTNWADLATTSNITAVDGKVRKGREWLDELLPYVNSIGTLGYTWGA